MRAMDIDVLITGSQKALACPPGVSVIVLSGKALNKVAASDTKCMYLDLKKCIEKCRTGTNAFHACSRDVATN